MTVGGMIKQRREELGYNAEYVAEKVGVSAATMYRYEKNEHEPVSKVLIKLADTLGTTVDYLLGRENKADAVKPKPFDTRQPYFMEMQYPFVVDLLEEHRVPPPTMVKSYQSVSEMQLGILSILLELTVTDQARVLLFAKELFDKQQEETQ